MHSKLKQIRWSVDPIKRLEELAEVQHDVDQLIDETVATLRAQHKIAWQAVGDILGLSTSTARRQFMDLEEDAPQG